MNDKFHDDWIRQTEGTIGGDFARANSPPAFTGPDYYAPPAGSAAPNGPLPSHWVPETPEEKADRLRRQHNEQEILRHAPFYTLGKVRSYFGEDGKVRLDDEGNLAVGKVVPRKVHLKRLQDAYQTIWQVRLRLGERQEDEKEKRLMMIDAMRRLSLLKRGRFLCPVDRKVHSITLDHRRKKKTLFGRIKIVDNRIPVVKVAEYDRRLRQFIFNVYRAHLFCELTVGGTRAVFCAPDVLIRMFLRYPQTRRML